MPAFAEQILYEDAELVAVNKPAGLLAVPDRYDKQKTNLFDRLQAARPGAYLANVHRLDRHTSGVMLFAKTSDAYQRLTAAFRDRQVRKLYLAVCAGHPDNQVIDLPIGARLDRPGYARIDQRQGKAARTVIRVAEVFRGHSLLEVTIETGRQHQIRVHLQAIGHPLVGDPDYGGAPLLLSQLKRGYKPKADEPERPLLARPALHAASLTLSHPAIAITAPLPHDLTVALKYLRKCAA